MNNPNNLNNEIETEMVFHLETEQEKNKGKRQKKLIARVEENLIRIVKEKISGRMGEC